MDTAAQGSGAEHERASSAEDVREYVQRMRSLPVEQVIGDVVFSLLNAAQVKLGRRDARLLIDLSTVAHEHARPYLSDGLTNQIDQVLGQLRMGQVNAESHASGPAQPEENDLDRVPVPPQAGATQLPGRQMPGRLAPRRDEPTVSGPGVGGRGVAEEVDADRYAADSSRFSAHEHAVRAGLTSDHEVVARVLQAPAELLYLAKYRGRTRRGVVPLGSTEPCSTAVTAHFELNLEERLPLFFRDRGRPGGRCHERLALPLLLRHSGLLGTSSVHTSLLGLTRPPLGFPLLGAFEHIILGSTSSRQSVQKPWLRCRTFQWPSLVAVLQGRLRRAPDQAKG